MPNNNDEPFKELIDPLIDELNKKREIFLREYDGRETSRSYRCQETVEASFLDQLDKVTHTFTAEQIGEFVIAFFNAYDEWDFN